MKIKETIGGIAIGVIAGALLIGGGIAVADSGGAFDNSVQDQATGQQNADTGRLIQTQPPPSIKYSVERQNLVQRYKIFSDKNKVSYIALTTMNGAVVYTGTVKGKISATSSQLTPSDRMQCANGDHEVSCATIQMPEPDGSWATNGAGIFWFDDLGVYHEWNGTYLTADAPFTLTTPPLLSITATAK